MRPRRLACGLLLLAAALSAAPQRIVSTAPAITEILFALGLGPRVVGVTAYCRYPAETARLPKIGTFLEPDLEKILALRPDLVFIIKNPVQLAARMRRLRLNVVELDPEKMDGVYAAIATIGASAGAAPQAGRLAATLRAGLEQVRAATAARPPRSVLFLVGRTTGTFDGMVGAAPGSYLDELLTFAGGRNVLADSPVAYLKLSLELILARDPEVIIDMGDAAHAEGWTAERAQAVRALWSRHAQLRAVRGNRVFPVADGYFVVPGPRMLDAARAFARMLHPEVRP